MTAKTSWPGFVLMAFATGCGGRSVQPTATTDVGGQTASAGAAGTGETVASAGMPSTVEPPVVCPSSCPSVCQDNRCLEVLASNLPTPTALALSHSDVYWSSTIGIMTVSKGGGTARSFVGEQDGIAHALAIDETHLYWSGSYGSKLMRASLASGASEVLAEDQSQLYSIALDSTAIYWASWETGTISSMPKAGGPARVLTAAARRPRALAVDATRLYWAEDVEADGAVMAMPLAGGTPLPLATAQDAPRGLGIDATHVYWTATFDETVCRVPLTGGAFEVLSKGTIYPEQLVVDDRSVFWVGNHAIEKAALSGGSTQELPGAEFPSAVAVDETSAYFLNDGVGGIEGNGTLIKLTPK